MSKYFDILAYLMGKQAGGGGDITVVSKSISTNGTYTAPSGKAYSPVTVDVPNSYAAGDEGKVVSNGELVAQSSDSVAQNGTVDTTLINSLTVNVSGGSVDWDGFAAGTWPSGAANLSNSVTDIAHYSFCYDGGITSLSGPEVLTANEYAIYRCWSLTTLYLPKLTRIGTASSGNSNAYCIAACYKLRTIHLPELTTVNSGYNLSSLGETDGFVTIVLPKISSIANHTFRSVKAEAIDLGPDLATLPGYNFYSGTYKNIILRRTSVVTAGAANAINSLDSSSKVYVPSALIDSYKAASNWSAKGDIFYAIEGSQYEHYYADGTPIQTT